MRKRIVKKLSFFIAIIIVLSCFCISTFAEEVPNELECDGFKIYSFNCYLRSSSGASVACNINITYSKPSNSAFGSDTLFFAITKTDGTSFNANEIYFLYGNFYAVDDRLFTTQNYVVGDFVVSTYYQRFSVINGDYVPSCYREDEYFRNRNYGSSSVSRLTSRGYDNVKFSYSKGEAGIAYWSYEFFLPLSCVTTYSTLHFFLHDFNFSVLTREEAASQGVIDNQDKNTDKILNGDSDLDSSGETGKVDGAIGDIDDATNNALGGKTEAEIQAEVSGALDFNNIQNGLDWDKANRMSVFYDRSLEAFGSGYNSLLLLSLVLGLGAFLIGRRYG